jgi:hypothetical protein
MFAASLAFLPFSPHTHIPYNFIDLPQPPKMLMIFFFQFLLHLIFKFYYHCGPTFSFKEIASPSAGNREAGNAHSEMFCGENQKYCLLVALITTYTL